MRPTHRPTMAEVMMLTIKQNDEDDRAETIIEGLKILCQRPPVVVKR